MGHSCSVPGALPPAPGGGDQSQPSPRGLRILFRCLSLANVSVPGHPQICSRRALEPSCSPAAVLGSGRLMETFIPSSSSPSPGCLSRNASCSPHARSSSTYRYLGSASQHGTAPGT